MDELTLLRSTRDDTREPSPTAWAAGRAALLDRVADEGAIATPAHHRPKRRVLPRLTWTAAAVAAALTGVLVVGNVNLSAQSAHASDVLHAAAVQAAQYTDLMPGSGEYLRSHTHARYLGCSISDDDPQGTACAPYEAIVDVYMPADPETEWVLFRDSEELPPGESTETTRAVGGRFYGPASSFVFLDFGSIPADGAAAYDWVDAQYAGGSASRDEDNFVRIAEILRSGLVPAPQRAALLDALSRIPGVAATDDVANLDGVKGVAIGRNEPVRAGQRQEIIIDPSTGLVIGERTLGGTTVFGWGPSHEVSLTAIETTIVDAAP